MTCSKCHGSGAEDDHSSKTCETCHGSGVVTRVANTILGQMQTQTTCPTCGGEGKIITKKCSECNGEGIVRDDEVITINIPAGVAEGMQLSMSGKGNAARHGGINGDLLILVEEEPHPELIRDENDILYNLLLSVPQAALGGTVEVPTIDGKAKVKIEPGTQPGKVLRLRNKGLPSVNSYGTGDLLVNVSVYIPETLSASEKDIMNGLRILLISNRRNLSRRRFSISSDICSINILWRLGIKRLCQELRHSLFISAILIGFRS